MNNSKYEEKYLKYKHKYLELKEILYGGVKEPQLGFQQHSGECWNDTISTILLYNNTTGDIVQNIFDTFSLEQIFEIMDRNISSGRIPSCFFPINIEETEPEQLRFFITQAKKYITNLYNRYKNESLEIPEFDSQNKPILKEGKLQRQCSFMESLSSVKSIMNITNYNSIVENHFDLDNHAGRIFDIETVLYIFNCFLINFDIVNHPEKPIEYLYYKDFVFNEHYFYKIKVINKDTILYIIEHIKEIMNTIKECYGIYIRLSKRVNETVNKDGDEEQQNIGHINGIFTSDSRTFFYDDNGVDDSVEGYYDHRTGFKIPINTYKTFRGKTALLKKFEYIINELTNKYLGEREYNFEIYSRKEIIKDITNIFNIITMIYNGYQDENIPRIYKTETIGKLYIHDEGYYIDNIIFILKDKYVDDANYYIKKNIKLYFNYNNKKAIDKIIMYKNVDNLEYDFDFANIYKNYSLIIYFLKNYEYSDTYINNININNNNHLYNLLLDISPDKNIDTIKIISNKVIYEFLKRKELDINQINESMKNYLKVIHSFYLDLDLSFDSRESQDNKDKKEIYFEIIRLILNHPVFEINKEINLNINEERNFIYVENHKFIYLELLNDNYEKCISQYSYKQKYNSKNLELKYKKTYQHIEIITLLYSDPRISEKFKVAIEEYFHDNTDLFYIAYDYVKNKLSVLSGGNRIVNRVNKMLKNIFSKYI